MSKYYYEKVNLSENHSTSSEDDNEYKFIHFVQMAENKSEN